MARKSEKTKKDQTVEVLENVEQSLTKAELFFENNRNPILIVAGGLLVLVLGYYAFQNYYVEPRERDAQREMFMAQKAFEQDSLSLALNGDGNNMGFLEIIDTYSGSKAANLARYYAGISYLNMGEFDKAIVYLDKFKSNDQILSVISKGAIGDAFMELNQPKEALEYYSKASRTNSNEFVIPLYLKKAAATAEILEDYRKALGFYQRIQKEFPDSREASDIEKDIAVMETKIKNAK
jgi:tetratricopeptide (TPR) repeat protein